ncbi:MAG: hypothetical protein M1835_006999 [Candelina submexicana]|nr:MAG: hypothetical protein M1835_006999 [Candelina submexicana]
MRNTGLRFLRPYLYSNIRPVRRVAHAAFINQAGKLRPPIVTSPTKNADSNRSGDVQQRINELRRASVELYPRLCPDARSMSCSEFARKYTAIKPEETREEDTATLRGRVISSRSHGVKLVFLDILQDGQRVQGVCNLRLLEKSGVSEKQFRNFIRIMRRGDNISITGMPHRTGRGELSVLATELPTLLSPSLHQLPTEITDPETKIRNRHADLLIDRRLAEVLDLRSDIIQYLRKYLLDDGFREVETPVLAANAGGAVARPFTTSASEFPAQPLSLRIAPELWLKRLILGGKDKVFEIGKSFRNEGVDTTHNPEFTTCEFYQAFATLEDLIAKTESMFIGLARSVENLKRSTYNSLPPLVMKVDRPFKRIDFLTAIQSALNCSLPNLEAPDATSQLLKLFQDHKIPPPSSPNLPRLVDKLSSLYVEPHCIEPTFIIYHPLCLSPLAKSFKHPDLDQRVSARVELFVQGRELVNAYEEENSSFEQREKFVRQQQFRDSDNEAIIDEGYLEALEWGLPPTGGWGCGVDRLCMLFSGAPRIADVLNFGTLTNVVGLSREGSK